MNLLCSEQADSTGTGCKIRVFEPDTTVCHLLACNLLGWLSKSHLLGIDQQTIVEAAHVYLVTYEWMKVLKTVPEYFSTSSSEFTPNINTRRLYIFVHPYLCWKGLLHSFLHPFSPTLNEFPRNQLSPQPLNQRKIPLTACFCPTKRPQSLGGKLGVKRISRNPRVR